LKLVLNGHFNTSPSTGTGKQNEIVGLSMRGGAIDGGRLSHGAQI
jgi:hypothetical protein